MTSEARYSLFIEATGETQGPFETLEQAQQAVEEQVPFGGWWSIDVTPGRTGSGHRVAGGKRRPH